ncbi:uncharacterized protein BKA78DRAFT_301106 [Phyllosticta capitalensis]|uniref:uncharacterized protein n=1 Tax=Phyllosticta capitalensis TaxID=121624 RepID=UPI003130381F
MCLRLGVWVVGYWRGRARPEVRLSLGQIAMTTKAVVVERQNSALWGRRLRWEESTKMSTSWMGACCAWRRHSW